MAKNACIKGGCQMARDGFTDCPVGVCIDDKAFSAGHLPTGPIWRMPIANVFSNDAAFGREWAHNAAPVGGRTAPAQPCEPADPRRVPLIRARPGSWLQALCMRLGQLS